MEGLGEGRSAPPSLRGLHLFVHPTLIYGAINCRPPRLLKRNLSYVGGRQPGAPPHDPDSGQTDGPVLTVRFDGCQVTGANIPTHVLLLVLLCEMTSTGRDLKPVRAATVALAGVAAGDAEEGEGKGERGQRGGGRLQQEQQGAPPAPPPPPLTHGSCSVRFHLPGRKLVRPTLIILASDSYLDLPTGILRRHTMLRTDLRGDGSLFGVLPEPCCAWAAMQPLADLLPPAAAVAATPPGPAATSLLSSPMDTGSQADVHQQQLSLPSLTLQRCRVSRSRVVARPRDGRQMVATLLHVQWAPGEEPQGLLGRPGAGGAPGLRVGGKGQAAGADAAPWLWDRPADQLVQVRAVRLGACLSVGWEVCVGREGPGQQGRGGAEAVEGEGGDEVVEFRYIFDDARLGGRRGMEQGWGEKEDGLRGEGALVATAGGVGGRGGAGAASSPTQLQAPMAGAAGCTLGSAKAVGSGLATPPPPPAASAGGGKSRHLGPGLARWMQQQLQGPEVHQQQAQGHHEQQQQQAGGEGGGRHGQQQRPQTPEPEAAGAAAGRGGGELHGAVERYFTDELAADVRGVFVCPMCSAGCVGVQGLSQHLPASHGFYAFRFLPPPPAGAAATGPAATAAAALQAGGRQGCTRRHVVEVRLRPDAVDVERSDLVTTPEHRPYVLQQGTQGDNAAPRPRMWWYCRSAGMARPEYLDLGLDLAQAQGQAQAEGGAAAVGAAEGGEAAAGAVQPPREAAEQAEAPSSTGRRGRKGQRPPPQQQAVAGTAAADGGAGYETRGARQGGDVAAAAADAAGAGRGRPRRGQLGGAGAGAAQAGGGAAEGQGQRQGSGSRLVQVQVDSLCVAIQGDTPNDAAAANGKPSSPGQAARGKKGRAAADADAVGRAALARAASAFHPPGRRYFHSRSGLPCPAAELFGADDSEDDTDQEEWEDAFLRHCARGTQKAPLLREQRHFFLLWARFTRRCPIHADYIVPDRCLQFCREQGPVLRQHPPLRTCLATHLALLLEYNLIDPWVLHRCLAVADGSIPASADADAEFLTSRNLGPPRRAAQGPAAGVGAAGAGPAPVARRLGRPPKGGKEAAAAAADAGAGPNCDGTAPGSCDEADRESGSSSSSGEGGSASEAGQGEETEDSMEVDGEQEGRDEPRGGWSGQEGTGSDEEGGSPVAGEGTGRRGRAGQGQGRQRGQGRRGRGRGRGRGGRGGPSAPVTRGAAGHGTGGGAPTLAGAAAGGGPGGDGGAASPGRRLGRGPAAGVEAGAAVGHMGVLEVEADSPPAPARGSPGPREVRVLGVAVRHNVNGGDAMAAVRAAAPLAGSNDVQHAGGPGQDLQQQHAASQQPTKPGQVWMRKGRLGLGSGLARGPLAATAANKPQGQQQELQQGQE